MGTTDAKDVVEDVVVELKTGDGGNLEQAYSKLVEEYTSFSQNNGRKPVEDFWQAVKQGLDEKDPELLGKLALVYGLERTDSRQDNVSRIQLQATAADMYASPMDRTLAGALLSNYDKLKSQTGFLSLIGIGPHVIMRNTLSSKIADTDYSLIFDKHLNDIGKPHNQIFHR